MAAAEHRLFGRSYLWAMMIEKPDDIEKPNEIPCVVCRLKMSLKQTVAAAAGAREQRFYQCEPCGIGEWRVTALNGGNAGERSS
jgi:hypothetical protein